MQGKNIFLKISVSVLAAAMLLTGCTFEADVQTSDKDRDSSATSRTTEPVTDEDTELTSVQEPESGAGEEFEDLADYVGTLSDLVDGELAVEKKIKWLCWYEPDETQAAAELFRQVYGIPEYGDTSYGDCADSIFEFIPCDYEDRYSKLAQLIAMGDSPDMFPFEIDNFPYTAVQGLFQPIDGYVDLTGPLWDGTREAIEQFRWDGKNYAVSAELSVDEVMWYRRSVIAEAGLEDPYELYSTDSWTWDTFLDMCGRWQKSGDDKYGVDGWFVPDRLILTTGVPLIGISGGRLQSNLYSADIERAMTDLIDVLSVKNYRYPRHDLNHWIPSVKEWAQGNTLFYAGSADCYKTDFQGYIRIYGWDIGELLCVPFPRDPKADAYYQSFKNDCCMLVTGSDNTVGFSAWVQCIAACANDQTIARFTREQLKADYNCGDGLLDILDGIKYGGRLTPVFDFKNGIGQDEDDSSSTYTPTFALTQIPYLSRSEHLEPADFTTLRAANEDIIRERIEELNASIAG